MGFPMHRKVRGYRSPYFHTNKNLGKVLADLGIS